MSHTLAPSGAGNGRRSTTTILVSLYSGRWQRASAVASPKQPEPIIRMEEGISGREGGIPGSDFYQLVGWVCVSVEGEGCVEPGQADLAKGEVTRAKSNEVRSGFLVCGRFAFSCFILARNRELVVPCTFDAPYPAPCECECGSSFQVSLLLWSLARSAMPCFPFTGIAICWIAITRRHVTPAS